MVKIKYRGDGTPLLGLRGFTPKELAEYKKNVYGKNYYRRATLKMWKNRTPEERSRIGKQTVETKLAIYGSDYFHKLGKNKARYLVKYGRSEEGRKMHSETAKKNNAKLVEARKAKGYTAIHPFFRYFFICDWQESNRKFNKLDYIYPSDPLFNKLYDMMIVCQVKQLETRDRKKVQHMTNVYNGVVYRCKRRLSKRPDIIFSVIKCQ